MGDGTLLIDCHSFSSIPNLLNSNPSEIDICIGYNDDMTCPDIEVINNIVRYFEYLGYRVGINKPFSNSKTFSVLFTVLYISASIAASLCVFAAAPKCFALIAASLDIAFNHRSSALWT